MRCVFSPIERLITRYSRDGNKTFFEPGEFHWIKTLEAGAPAIREELEQLLARPDDIPNIQDLSENQKYLTQGGNWRTYLMYLYGKACKENCERCPETVRLLQAIPGMKTAMFSILAAGTHLPAHYGPYKGVLRYHLGLIVPKPESLCRIRVGADTRSWVEGRSLVFDDRHMHEAWNDSNESRTVLFVDFVRPLPWPLDPINRAAIWAMSLTFFAREGVKNARRIAQSKRLTEPGARV